MTLRRLGFIAAFICGTFMLVMTLDITAAAAGIATVAFVGSFLFLLSLTWTQLKLSRLQRLFEESKDPTMNEETFQEVVEDLNRWSKIQFGRFTNVVCGLSVALWYFA